MAEFSGVRDLAAVLTGGNAIEQAAYNSAQQRLISERSQRALMEKRIAQAAQQKIEHDSLQSLLQTMPPGRDRDILIAKLGSSFSGLQTGLGTEQQNTARGLALDQVLMGGNTDMINQLTGIASDKLMTPNNVQVQRQAAAQATRDEAAAALTQGQLSQKLPAEVSAIQALTGQREARRDKALAETGQIGLTAEDGSLEPIPAPPPGKTLYDSVEDAFGIVSNAQGLAGRVLDVIPGLGLPEFGQPNVEARARFNTNVRRFANSLARTRAFKEQEIILKEQDILPSAFTGEDTARERIQVLDETLRTMLAQEQRDSKDPLLDKKARAEASSNAAKIANFIVTLGAPQEGESPQQDGAINVIRFVRDENGQLVPAQ